MLAEDPQEGFEDHMIEDAPADDPLGRCVCVVVEIGCTIDGGSHVKKQSCVALKWGSGACTLIKHCHSFTHTPQTAPQCLAAPAVPPPLTHPTRPAATPSSRAACNVTT